MGLRELAVGRWQLGKCKQRAPAEEQASDGQAASTLARQQEQRLEQLEDAMLKVLLTRPLTSSRCSSWHLMGVAEGRSMW